MIAHRHLVREQDQIIEEATEDELDGHLNEDQAFKRKSTAKKRPSQQNDEYRLPLNDEIEEEKEL